MVLIVLEGIDGSGKGTQSKLLVSRLLNDGFSVVTHSFPSYGHPAAVGVERYLRGELGALGAKEAAMLFASDRAVISREKLLPALSAGKIVVLDRYVSSNAAHQGGKISGVSERVSFLEWLSNLEFVVNGVPKPDVVLFLDVNPLFSVELLKSRGKPSDIHEKDLIHLNNAYSCYSWLAKRDGWQKISCIKNNDLRSVEDIHEEIYSIILNHLAKRN